MHAPNLPRRKLWLSEFDVVREDLARGVGHREANELHADARDVTFPRLTEVHVFEDALPF